MTFQTDARNGGRRGGGRGRGKIVEVKDADGMIKGTSTQLNHQQTEMAEARKRTQRENGILERKRHGREEKKESKGDVKHDQSAHEKNHDGWMKGRNGLSDDVILLDEHRGLVVVS